MKSNKLKYLEGMRGIAALIVLLSHLQHAFFYNFPDNIATQIESFTGSSLLANGVQSFIYFFLDGNLAVYIFWFLSGYVLSIKLFKGADSIYLYKAVLKRYLRLLIPALSSVLIAFVLMKFGFMYNVELSNTANSTLDINWLNSMYNFVPTFSNALKSGIWDTFFDYNREHNYNIVLWTMNPELLGSFLVFITFGLVGKFKLRYLVYLSILLVAYFFIKFWVISFLLGFVMSDIDFNKNSNIRNQLTLLFQFQKMNVILFFALIAFGGIQYESGILDIIVSSALVVLLLKTKALQQFFNHKPIVWLGKISFGLYLIHLPIICSFSSYLYLSLPLEPIAKLGVIIPSTLILVFITSYLFTKYIDDWSVMISNRFANSIVSSKKG